MINSNFYLWKEVRGHWMTSAKSFCKSNTIFELPSPRKLLLNIHHVIIMNLLFLTSDQRSFLKNNAIFKFLDPKIKFIILPCCMSRYMFFGSRNSKIALFFKCDLLEVTQWPLTSCQRSKIKFIILPCCMSRYMFFGSRNSKIALFFKNDLSEVTQ